MMSLIDRLYKEGELEEQQLKALLLYLLNEESDKEKAYLFSKARQKTDEVFGRKIYIRGLIEFTNICSKDCLYCGIRKSNKKVRRYRLTKKEILATCDMGYTHGFRTFVLQGGEDGAMDDETMVSIISEIKKKYPDCAVTLSIGEREANSYKMLKQAGADRFLLRHETIDKERYHQFHPKMSYENRLTCLKRLKELGFQTGTGFLIGLPNQKKETYVKDLLYMKQLKPQMVGIGPYIMHEDTPLKGSQNGDVTTTLVCLAILRLFLPNALIPSTTALNTLSNNGFINGFNAGANVIMLNLTPNNVRENYALYKGKAHIDVSKNKAIEELKEKLAQQQYCLDMSIGNYEEKQIKRKD